MIVRIETHGLDEAVCAGQGYLAAVATNFAIAATIINPVNGAIIAAGTALTQKGLSFLSDETFPDYSVKIGPYSMNVEKAVTYTLAGCTVVHFMVPAGLIAAAPLYVTVTGAVAWIILTIGIIAKLIFPKSAEDCIRAIFQSKTLVDRFVRLRHMGKSYDVRLIHNPQKREVVINKISTTGPVWVISRDIPYELEKKIHKIIAECYGEDTNVKEKILADTVKEAFRSTTLSNKVIDLPDGCNRKHMFRLINNPEGLSFNINNDTKITFRYAIAYFSDTPKDLVEKVVNSAPFLPGVGLVGCGTINGIPMFDQLRYIVAPNTA